MDTNRMKIEARRNVVRIAKEQMAAVTREMGQHHTVSVYSAFMAQRAFGIARSWDNPTTAKMDEIATVFMAVADPANYEIVYVD